MTSSPAREPDHAYVALGNGEASPGADARAAAAELTRDPATSSLRNLWCVWAVSFLTAIDGTVAVPSLWRYVESLGGDEEYYGLCISGFAAARVLSMGAFGLWVDRRPYREVFLASLTCGMAAGVLYAAAPTVGRWAVLAGRLVLGSMSAVSVATQAFVANHTSQADRTKSVSASR